jgi:hypothetical protein
MLITERSWLMMPSTCRASASGSTVATAVGRAGQQGNQAGWMLVLAGRQGDARTFSGGSAFATNKRPTLAGVGTASACPAWAAPANPESGWRGVCVSWSGLQAGGLHGCCPGPCSRAPPSCPDHPPAALWLNSRPVVVTT